MYKIDLHTHSFVSHDGGITASEYNRLLASGTVDCIAVTDHNRIDCASQLQKDLGNRIIIGEEIMTSLGEIIGIYLTELVPANLTPQETVKRIKDQGGLVYIPHPFETIRKGLDTEILDSIVDNVDIIEVFNGRAFLQDKGQKAVVWARINEKAGAASSDAHGIKGVGHTYTQCKQIPTRDTLVELLQSGATPITSKPPLRTLLYPKYHKVRKKLGKQHG